MPRRTGALRNISRGPQEPRSHGKEEARSLVGSTDGPSRHLIMKKWIITGGAGFIGCHAAARLHAAGHRVVLVDNLSRRGAEINLAWLRSPRHHRLRLGRHPRHPRDARAPGPPRRRRRRPAPGRPGRRHHQRRRPPHRLRDQRPGHPERPRGGPDRGRAAARRSCTARRTRSTATSSTSASSSATAATPTRTLPLGVSEDEPLDFHSPYGCSKGAGDQYVRDYARIYGLKTVTFRQSCIYGTRQFGIEDQGWIAWFCIAATDRPAVHDLRRRQADPRRPLGG